MSNLILSNRYEIMEKVKSGAMGCIFKARDSRLDRIAAVKMMFSGDSAGDNKDRLNLFKSEARMLSKLHHRGLPKVTDFFTEYNAETKNQDYYIVMSWIDGPDLETIMESRKNQPLPVDTAMDYFRQILEILRYLHSGNPPVIYRDFKPPNLMVSDGRVYLTDFGIARFLERKKENVMAGTPGYAAPEQLAGITDQRSDLYSLGVLMHFLLTGKDPQKAKQFQFESIRKFNRDVPEYFEDIIECLVCKEPERRPPSAEEVIKMFEAAKKKADVSPKVVIENHRNDYAENYHVGFSDKMKTGLVTTCILLALLRVAALQYLVLRFSLADIIVIPAAGVLIWSILYFLNRPAGYEIRNDIAIARRYWSHIMAPETFQARILFLAALGILLILAVLISSFLK
ncbi:MAG: serine/threonine protein kinase [Firmicutes bacterium]|nr:serine/threonine protein kinase [Bacillota bacterium]